MILTPKNWKSFQHYKDRAPAWIKLHRGLIDNHEYHRLSPEAAKYLPLIWIIASERDGAIPAGAELAFRLRIEEELANDILVELLGSDFLVSSDAETAEQVATLAQRMAKSNGFGNRHVSDVVKRAVWARDGGICCQCSSGENIEYDHKVPVSKGGNSNEENIQLLCRPCNRAKRVKLATPAQPPSSALRSLEERRRKKEKQEKKEEEKRENIRADALDDDWPSDYGDLFWKAYPRKEEKLSAMKKLASLRKSGAVTFADLMAGVQRYCAAQREPQFTKQPTVWLNKGCWADEIQSGAPNGHRTNGFHSNPSAGRPPTRDASVIAGMGRALDRRRADRAAANGNGELRGHPDAAGADAAERKPEAGDDGASGQPALVPAGHAGQ